MTVKAIARSMAILAITSATGFANRSQGAEERRSSPLTAEVPTNGWLGIWVGKNGATLTIAADGGPYSGKYHITLKSVGKRRQFAGLAYLETIVFERDGQKENIRMTTGKGQCLIIGMKERYCRG